MCISIEAIYQVFIADLTHNKLKPGSDACQWENGQQKGTNYSYTNMDTSHRHYVLQKKPVIKEYIL